MINEFMVFLAEAEYDQLVYINKEILKLVEKKINEEKT